MQPAAEEPSASLRAATSTLTAQVARIGTLPPADVRNVLRLVDSFLACELYSEEDKQRLRPTQAISAILRERCVREDALKEQLDAALKKETELNVQLEARKPLEAQLASAEERIAGMLRSARWMYIILALIMICLACFGTLQYQCRVRLDELQGKERAWAHMPNPLPEIVTEILSPPPPPPPPVPPLPIYPLMSELPLIEHCVPVTFPIPEVMAHQISYSDLSYALHYHQDHVVPPVCAIHVGLPYCYCVMRDNVSAPHVDMFNPRLVGYSLGDEGMAMVQESGLACPRLAWLIRFRVVWIRYQDTTGMTVERRFDRPLAYEIQHLLELLAGDTSCGAERLSTLSRLVRDGRDNTNIRWLGEPPREMYNGDPQQPVRALGQ